MVTSAAGAIAGEHRQRCRGWRRRARKRRRPRSPNPEITRVARESQSKSFPARPGLRLHWPNGTPCELTAPRRKPHRANNSRLHG